MEGKCDKRPRSQNWDIQEKISLIVNIREHINIIENKKKLTSSNKTKEAAWKMVQEALKMEGYYRDIPRLKEQWLRLKTHAKKNIAAFKRERKQTGGGSVVVSEPWEYDYYIKDMIPHEFTEDVSQYDSESLPANSIVTKPIVHPQLEPESPQTFENNSDIFEIEYEDDRDVEINSVERPTSELNTKDFATPRSSQKTRKMSAYEESMFELNKKKIKLSMEHAEALHQLQKQKILLEIDQAKELHTIKLQQIKCKNGN